MPIVPGVRWLAIACVATVVASSPAAAYVGNLSVSPGEPACTDSVTLRSSGWFPDACWNVFSETFSVQGDTFVFTVRAHDVWAPGTGCAAIIEEYGGVETVGPLPAGPYTVTVREIVTSQRYEGETRTVPFEVVCCAPLPEPVAGLRLDKVDDGERVWLTWFDDAGTDDYVIYADPAADGPFAEVAGIAGSGLVGLEIDAAGETAFFLIAGRNPCGVAPPRRQE